MEPPPSDPPLTLYQNGNNHHNDNDSRPIPFARSIWQKAGSEYSCGLAGCVTLCDPIGARGIGDEYPLVLAHYPYVCCPLSLSVTPYTGSTVEKCAGYGLLALHL